MITQYQIQLEPNKPCCPTSEWAYRLYAALLERAPTAFATELHRDGVTPVSQFLDCRDGMMCWTVNLLGEQCEECLSPVLDKVKPYYLHREQLNLVPVSIKKSHIAGVEELFSLAEKQKDNICLEFVTPTAFKRKGKYYNLPDTELIFHNLVQKWNATLTECPIEDEDSAGVDTMAAGFICESFHLHSSRYYLKGHPISGFEGTMVLRNQLHGFHRQLADTLLVFAGYSGIGIKTTLGMGGVK